MDIYKRYSDYLKEAYGQKVYKLPVVIPVSCPNREGDGMGCTFCGGAGAGFENLPNTLSIPEQIQRNMEYIGKKYKAEKFIVYFQSFSNTFLPPDLFAEYMESAIMEHVVEIAVSTRPDCIAAVYLQILAELEKKHGVRITVELGLQSANYHSLLKVNRGHTLAEFIDASILVKQFGFNLCAHVILNLPWDDAVDAIESAKLISVLHFDFVKLHALYIEKDTEMARQFLAGEFTLCTKEVYCQRVQLFLQYLDPTISIQRLLGRVPQENTLFSNWSQSWWRIRDEIEESMRSQGICQGDAFDYLGGKAVKRFLTKEENKAAQALP